MILNLDNPAHAHLIARYPKVKGLQQSNKYLPELNPLEKCYIIENLDEWRKVEKEFPEHNMTVRSDVPKGKGIGQDLPKGQTFDRSRVEEYIQNVKKVDSDAVVILQHMKPGTNERLNTKGAMCLWVEVGDKVVMEYCGPSSDCGDITGKASAHATWIIPWDEVLFLKSSKMRKWLFYEIDSDGYQLARESRIKDLVTKYCTNVSEEEIRSTVPANYKKMPQWMFDDIVEQVLVPLYCKREELLRNGLNRFGFECNIVSDGRIVPMELSVPERFQNQEKECER